MVAPIQSPGDLRHCSQHARCQGPSLVKGHRCTTGENCDNDQCWVPCMFCVGEGETVLYQAMKLKPGWLKADMERASARCAIWKAEGTLPIVPTFSARSTLKDKQK